SICSCTKTEGKQMIESYSFGSMTITGQSHRNDLKIIENKIVGNWWRREGHALYAQDIDDILYASVETLVVGTGAYGGMKVTEEAAQAIEGQGISLVAVPTKEAVSIFNSLHAQGKRVAGAFHLTC
ncbi:MAG: MTH938/NDUFAF3 family protein, partial [Syntrophobacteria bacterium]